MYKNADTVWHTPYFVLFFLKSDILRQVGFVAGKKVGNAVKRNRAKRLLRAHFLSHIDNLTSGHFVFVAKARILDDDFATVARAFGYALKRSGGVISKR